MLAIIPRKAKMNAPSPYYMVCYSLSEEQYNTYKTVFFDLYHFKEHLIDEHQYFLQFKAAALTSVIIANRDLHKHTNAILGLCDIAKHGWSMQTNMVGRNAEALNENYLGKIPHNQYDEPFSWRRTEWRRSTVHSNDETYCLEAIY
jgi:hypothetical protein